MFYRFKSKFATQDRVQAYLSLFRWGPHPSKYEDLFKVCAEPKSNVGIVYYLAPETDFFANFAMQFNPGKEQEPIPDLWGVDNYLVCSQRFREVLCALDPMPHQFTPLPLHNTQQQPVEAAQPYYWLNLRRFVFTPISELRSSDLPFMPSPYEEHLFYQIQQHPQLAEELSQIPIWRSYSDNVDGDRVNQERQIVYFSAATLIALQQAGLTGLTQYSVPGGQGEESVVAVIS